MASVSFEGFEWSLAGDLDRATHDVAAILLEATVAALKAEKRGLVLFFDEAQVLIDDKAATGSHPLSSLIAAVSTLQKQQVPISLVLCGLPTLAVNLLSARTYTERMFRGFKVDSLNFEDAAKAFTEPLDLLLASAQRSYPPLAVAELNDASTKSNDNVNVLPGRLVKANVLCRPRKGPYLYTAPKFREYLHRRTEQG
jgi:hypothetical protein